MGFMWLSGGGKNFLFRVKQVRILGDANAFLHEKFGVILSTGQMGPLGHNGAKKECVCVCATALLAPLAAIGMPLNCQPTG